MNDNLPINAWTRRWTREWRLLWFGKVHSNTWRNYDNDRPTSPKTWRAPDRSEIIWSGPIGDLLDEND